MIRLKVDPKLRRCAERLGQEPCSFGRNTSLAPNQLVHPLDGDPDVLSKRNLRYA
jgi:hypothetical protein